MSIINIRVTEEEKELIKTYADFFGVSVSDFIKTSVLERIEDLFDLRSIEEYEKNKENDSLNTFSIIEVKNQLGLWRVMKLN